MLQFELGEQVRMLAVPPRERRITFFIDQSLSVVKDGQNPTEFSESGAFVEIFSPDWIVELLSTARTALQHDVVGLAASNSGSPIASYRAVETHLRSQLDVLLPDQGGINESNMPKDAIFTPINFKRILPYLLTVDELQRLTKCRHIHNTRCTMDVLGFNKSFGSLLPKTVVKNEEQTFVAKAQSASVDVLIAMECALYHSPDGKGTNDQSANSLGGVLRTLDVRKQAARDAQATFVDACIDHLKSSGQTLSGIEQPCVSVFFFSDFHQSHDPRDEVSTYVLDHEWQNLTSKTRSVFEELDGATDLRFNAVGYSIPSLAPTSSMRLGLNVLPNIASSLHPESIAVSDSQHLTSNRPHSVSTEAPVFYSDDHRVETGIRLALPTDSCDGPVTIAVAVPPHSQLDPDFHMSCKWTSAIDNKPHIQHISAQAGEASEIVIGHAVKQKELDLIFSRPFQSNVSLRIKSPDLADPIRLDLSCIRVIPQSICYVMHWMAWCACFALGVGILCWGKHFHVVSPIFSTKPAPTIRCFLFWIVIVVAAIITTVLPFVLSYYAQHKVTLL